MTAVRRFADGSRAPGWDAPVDLEKAPAEVPDPASVPVPAELDSVATFYDMLETSPAARHSVYVCTNISCSLCGADELYETMRAAAGVNAGEEPDVNVR